MKILRFVPFFAFAILITALSLQSCKQEQKPATNPADSAKSVAQPAAPAEGAKTITMNDKAKQGQLLYYNANLGKVHVACATCHADGTPKTQGNQIRQGHTLAGVTSRTATWNGMYKADQLKKYAYGGSLCAAVFQKRADIKTVDKALSADEVDALNEYLAAISTGSGAITTDLKIQWVGKPTFSDNPPDQKIAGPASKAIMKLPGDPKAGETVFGQTCGTCHSINDKKIGPPMVKAAKDMNVVAQTVRFGSGDMAFYAKDVLTDQQIADAIAYIQSQLGK
ncbi:MAG: c-type cytochrome [Candidatus Kapaibacterium sp.]